MRLLKWAGWVIAALIAAVIAASVLFQPAPELRGTWISRGYGYGLDIGRFRTRIFDLSPVHCTVNMTIPSNTWLLDKSTGYRFTAQGDEMIVQVDEILNPIHADRAPLPGLCADPPEPTRAHVYDVFWHSFAAHYPSFELYGADWDSRRDPGPLPDDAALLRAMTRALDGIEDGHVLIATSSGDIHWAKPDPTWIDEARAFASVSEARVSALERVQIAGISHGWLPGNIAYIRLDHMEPDRPLGARYRDHAARLLRPLAALYDQADGLVLDIRWNTGGSDSAALGYADLFSDQPRQVGTKVVQTAPGTFTGPVPIEVRPPGAAGFDMPVILLTSGQTASAAEIFTMALRDLPRVTVMGTETGGDFSDMLLKRLPNGWLISLSHQVYRTPDGTNHEGRGLPPDLYRPFDAEGFRAGTDSLLDEAAAALRDGVIPPG